MNSLDAIIALIALLTIFGMILTFANLQKENLSVFDEEMESKISAINCATIIDSIFSSSANNYKQEIDCFVENNKVFVDSKKYSQTIAKVEKTDFIKVITLEHYFK